MNTDLTTAITNARDNWMYKWMRRWSYDDLAYLDRNQFSDATVDTTINSTTVTMDSTTNVVDDMYVSGYGVASIQVESVTNSTTFELVSAAGKTANNVTMLFSALSEEEENVYWAEINFGRYEFLELLARKKLYHRKAASESISEGGTTHSTSGLIGSKMASREFLMIAKNLMKMGGYSIEEKLQRGNSMHYNRVRT